MVTDNSAKEYKCVQVWSYATELNITHEVPVMNVQHEKRHGKGDPDHEGSVTKEGTRKAIRAGVNIRNPQDHLKYLNDNYKKPKQRGQKQKVDQGFLIRDFNLQIFARFRH